MRLERDGIRAVAGDLAGESVRYAELDDYFLACAPAQGQWTHHGGLPAQGGRAPFGDPHRGLGTGRWIVDHAIDDFAQVHSFRPLHSARRPDGRDVGADAGKPERAGGVAVAVVADHSYLEAWCRSAEGVRLFRFDRIVDATVLDEPSAPPPPAVQAEPDTSLFDADPSLPSATLLIDRSASWMFDYYPLRVIRELPNGACEAAMTYASDEWMTRFVLGFGSAVRVLAPESLAQRVREAATAALSAYEVGADSPGR